MNRIQTTALLLSLLLLLSSCGIIIINRPGEETTAAGTEPRDTVFTYIPESHPVLETADGYAASMKSLAALESADLGGRSVFIGAAAETGDFFNDEDSIYRAALLRRDALLTEKFNIKLFSQRQTDADLLHDVSLNEKAGEYYADFVSVRNGSFGGYLSGKLIANLRSLPCLDLRSSCFDQNVTASFTFGSAVYGVYGYGCDDPMAYPALYYNVTAGRESGISLDYAGVYRGNFTYDVLFAMAEGYTGTGAALMTEEDTDSMIGSAFLSAGCRLVQSAEGVHTLCTDPAADPAAETLRKLVSLFTSSVPVTRVIADTAAGTALQETDAAGMEAFAAGKALFCFGTLADMLSLADCGFAWEVLPLPKTDEAAAFVSGMSPDAPIFLALSAAVTPEDQGRILQALFTASEGYIKACFYNKAMTDLITSAYTLDMVDLIVKTPVFDPAFALAEGNKELRKYTVTQLLNAVKEKGTLSELLAKYQEKANTLLRDPG